jgi:hypothetical protein
MPEVSRYRYPARAPSFLGEALSLADSALSLPRLPRSVLVVEIVQRELITCFVGLGALYKYGRKLWLPDELPDA